MSNAQASESGLDVVHLEISGRAHLSTDLVKSLDDGLSQTEDIGESGLLVVRVVGGEEPAASYHWPGQANIEMVNKWERAVRRMERTASTTLVVAEGNCSGLALELLLVADRRLARSNLRIQIAAPIWPGMGIYRLVHQIGYARSRKLMLSGAELQAELAREFDIIDDITDSDLEAVTRVNLRELAAIDDFAVRRRLLQDGLSSSFDEAIGAHLAACDRTLRRDGNRRDR
jgi:isomerase DpgB